MTDFFDPLEFGPSFEYPWPNKRSKIESEDSPASPFSWNDYVSESSLNIDDLNDLLPLSSPQVQEQLEDSPPFNHVPESSPFSWNDYVSESSLNIDDLNDLFPLSSPQIEAHPEDSPTSNDIQESSPSSSLNDPLPFTDPLDDLERFLAILPARGEVEGSKTEFAGQEHPEDSEPEDGTNALKLYAPHADALPKQCKLDQIEIGKYQQKPIWASQISLKREDPSPADWDITIWVRRLRCRWKYQSIIADIIKCKSKGIYVHPQITSPSRYGWKEGENGFYLYEVIQPKSVEKRKKRSKTQHQSC
eukprot:TRINITY_DN3922_c0_g1_i2.p1 TRINITY_DN3922_c0_g1~~TRINITY_DN3922_c0_g1_i2.p1  ORF type:complete len:304 (-),score=59.15 TRINITY_DN3922_c0_g1_i2:175-1086(-)